jgi:hypothetical protein
MVSSKLTPYTGDKLKGFWNGMEFLDRDWMINGYKAASH